MNLSEQNHCFELPLEVHEHPKSCSHSECGSDLPTSDAEQEKAASNHVIDVTDEVVEASKAEPEMREVKMDVDIDACERPTTRKKFLETNDQTFAFCGMILNKKCKMFLFVTLPLMTIVPTLFWYFNLQDEELWIRIGSGILFLMPVAFALITFCREPGYIPRVVENPHPDLDEIATCVVNAKTYKWCHTCHIWRPERAKHCHQMDACVHVFDHYCPWVGNAIGARNYFPFYMFLFTSAAALIVGSIEGFCTKWRNQGSTERNIIFFITVILGIFFGFFITLQFLSNTYNLYTGKTTQEFFLGRKGSSKRGVFANLAIFCPARASLIKY